MNHFEFDELTGDIYDNQDNKDLKITVDKKTYDLKNAKNFWTKITKSKISRSEAKKLYKELIRKDIDALKREKSNGIKKYNILDILENTYTIFTGTYLHYKDVSEETKFERSITDRVK